MIINGGSRSNAQFFAKHLTNGEENERVTLCEIRNLAALSIPGAFREMSAIAQGTRARNYFYHANINPVSEERLTPAQWVRAVALLEENLRLTGHARFVVEHEKKGRVHRHAVWSRIDVIRMRAVEMADDYERHQATARQLEQEFGLRPGRSVLGPHKATGERPARRPKPWETFRGHRTGIDPHGLTAHVTALYRSSKDPKAFTDALQAHGLRLVKGDCRDLCIVDQAGHLHSLGRRLQGVSASALAEFMKEFEPEA